MKWTTLRSGHVNRTDVLRRRAPHELLEVAESGSETEIKAAYRRQVRIYHPDRLDPFLRSHGEEIMKLLNDAYHSLLPGPGR